MVEHQNAPHSSEHGATENQETTGQTGPASVLETGASRRRLLRLGAVSAPVVASLLSRPASATYGGWGGGGGNHHPRCTTSGYHHMSSASGMIGMSPNDMGDTETCELDSPWSWKEKTKYSNYFCSDNYSTSLPKSKKIGHCFSNVPALPHPWQSSYIYPSHDYSLYYWLKYSNDDCKRVIAMYLAKKGNADCAVSLSQCDTMFTSVCYNMDVTISGDNWTCQEVKDFCRQFYT